MTDTQIWNARLVGAVKIFLMKLDGESICAVLMEWFLLGSKSKNK
jgi:hypothetical protein